MSDKTWSENTDSMDEEANATDDDDVLPWDEVTPDNSDGSVADHGDGVPSLVCDASDDEEDAAADAPTAARPVVLAQAVPASAGPRPRAAAPRPRASSKAPASELGLEHEVLLSLTVTPATKRNNVPLTEPVQLQNVQALLRATGDACAAARLHGIRLLQGVIARFLIGIEAGSRRGKYHLQGILVMKTIERNPEMVVYAVTQFMHAVVNGVGLNVRITKQIKPVAFGDELYIGGYVQKDVGLRHHSERKAGYTSEWLERATRVYRSKAGSNTYSSDKINNHPEKDRRAVALNTANLLTTGRWFLLKEGLRALLPVASVAARVSWMLQTDNYYLDAKIISGDKGAPLEEARFEALNLLFYDPRARENLAVIRCVLYGSGAMQPSVDAQRVHAMVPAVLGLPSREQVEQMNLHRAKAFTRRFDPTAAVQTPAPALAAALAPAAAIGVAIIVDLAGSRASARAAATLQSHGFLVRSLFATNQYPNACGHLAEMSAVMLRHAGTRFDELRLEQVQGINTYSCIRMQEGKLGRTLAENAAPPMLSDDQILLLATADNPDARGTAPMWMPGPGPFNAFSDALRDSTLPEGLQDGEVKIMIVNTVEVDGLATDFVGEHWLTIAWQLRPAPAEAAALV